MPDNCDPKLNAPNPVIGGVAQGDYANPLAGKTLTVEPVGCDGGGCGDPCSVCGAEYGGACDGGEPCRNGVRRCVCNDPKPAITAPAPVFNLELHQALIGMREPDVKPMRPVDVAPYENKRQHWIQSYTGKAVDVFDLQPDQIDLLDIAHALSNLCRYTGHTREFYSVATHSLAVMKLTEMMGHDVEMQLWALLHDAGEAYMADIAAPLKRHPIFEGYRKLEAENDRRIRARFGIVLEDSQLTLIRTFDMAMLTPERAALMAKPPRDWGTFPIIEAAGEALAWAMGRTEHYSGEVVPSMAERAYLGHFTKLAGTRP